MTQAAESVSAVRLPPADGNGILGAALDRRGGEQIASLAGEWPLPAGPQAAREARKALNAWFVQAGIDPASESAGDILLAASELAGNAGEHGRPPVTLAASAERDDHGIQVTVAVSDGSTAVPQPREAAGELDERGRGLSIVGQLANWVETKLVPAGKQARFGVQVLTGKGFCPGTASFA